MTAKSYKRKARRFTQDAETGTPSIGLHKLTITDIIIQ